MVIVVCIQDAIFVVFVLFTNNRLFLRLRFCCIMFLQEIKCKCLLK